MNYKSKYSYKELRDLQRMPKIVALKNSTARPLVIGRMLDNYFEYLKAKYPIPKYIAYKLHHKNYVDKSIAKEDHLGIVLLWDKRAVIHVATQKRPIFYVMCTLAHEYWHAYQTYVLGRGKEADHILEMDAIEFEYDVTVEYLTKEAQNELRIIQKG